MDVIVLILLLITGFALVVLRYLAYLGRGRLSLLDQGMDLSGIHTSRT